MAQPVDPAVLADRIQSLVDELAADARSRAVAGELVRALMQFYGAALERMVTQLAAADRPVRVDDLVSDPVVAAVLALHALHPNPAPSFASPGGTRPDAIPLLQITRADGTPVTKSPRDRAAV